MKEKERRVINRFQRLLRSGKDYDVHSMYKEAGDAVCIVASTAQGIVNKYYRGLITQEMIEYVKYLDELCNSPADNILCFAEKFSVCERESRLLIRYIKRM